MAATELQKQLIIVTTIRAENSRKAIKEGLSMIQGHISQKPSKELQPIFEMIKKSSDILYDISVEQCNMRFQ